MFLTKLAQQTVTEGDPLTMECEVIGTPEPTIQWLCDGNPLPENVNLNESYDGRVARLNVERVGLENSGLYECCAENSGGEAFVSARVTVQSKC